MLRVGEVGNRFSELLGLQKVRCCARASRQPTLHKLRMDEGTSCACTKAVIILACPGLIL